MSNTFNDDYTARIRMVMEEFEQVIYDIEDGLFTLDDKKDEIIAYLGNIRCSMPLGLMLRRYLCGKFSDEPYSENAETIDFTLDDGRKISVKNYAAEDYDILTDDVKEYTELCLYINEKYNKRPDGSLALDLSKAEFRRMLRVTTECTRSKMFTLSFALHMNSDELTKFLTDSLAEQTYNFRNPEEIVAFYCHNHEAVNNYGDYQRILKDWEERLSLMGELGEARQNYTWYAKVVMAAQVATESELLAFMEANAANFKGYSETAYREFMQLYYAALDRSYIQSLSVSNEDYLYYSGAETREQLKSRVDRINKAIGIKAVSNTEQLAKVMLEYVIPRDSTKKTTKDGRTIVENDFTTIYNGENGQSNKKKTTTLPKSITVNLPMKDRLDDLIRGIKPVDRKDLVLFKFYVFSRDLENKEEYLAIDYRTFMEECNEMLVRCGMSKLYPPNRFENLILLSLVSNNPFEMFGDIIDSSFIEKRWSEGGDEE